MPTPHDEEHRPDISHVLAAARAIAPKLEPGNLVILESTSPVGTTEKVAELIAALRPDLKVPGASTGAARPLTLVAALGHRVMLVRGRARRLSFL